VRVLRGLTSAGVYSNNSEDDPSNTLLVVPFNQIQHLALAGRFLSFSPIPPPGYPPVVHLFKLRDGDNVSSLITLVTSHSDWKAKRVHDGLELGTGAQVARTLSLSGSQAGSAIIAETPTSLDHRPSWTMPGAPPSFNSISRTSSGWRSGRDSESSPASLTPGSSRKDALQTYLTEETSGFGPALSSGPKSAPAPFPDYGGPASARGAPSSGQWGPPPPASVWSSQPPTPTNSEPAWGSQPPSHSAPPPASGWGAPPPPPASFAAPAGSSQWGAPPPPPASQWGGAGAVQAQPAPQEKSLIDF